jgi:hypothetical protein
VLEKPARGRTTPLAIKVVVTIQLVVQLAGLSTALNLTFAALSGGGGANLLGALFTLAAVGLTVTFLFASWGMRKWGALGVLGIAVLRLPLALIASPGASTRVVLIFTGVQALLIIPLFVWWQEMTWRGTEPHRETRADVFE